MAYFPILASYTIDENLLFDELLDLEQQIEKSSEDKEKGNIRPLDEVLKEPDEE